MKLIPAAEVLRRLHTGEAEVAYARDEENGYTYITLKETKDGYKRRTTDPARSPPRAQRDLLTE